MREFIIDNDSIYVISGTVQFEEVGIPQSEMARGSFTISMKFISDVDLKLKSLWLALHQRLRDAGFSEMENKIRDGEETYKYSLSPDGNGKHKQSYLAALAIIRAYTAERGGFETGHDDKETLPAQFKNRSGYDTVDSGFTD